MEKQILDLSYQNILLKKEVEIIRSKWTKALQELGKVNLANFKIGGRSKGMINGKDYHLITECLGCKEAVKNLEEKINDNENDINIMSYFVFSKNKKYSQEEIDEIINEKFI